MNNPRPLHDPWYRLTNLYHIIDKDGCKRLFKPNRVQTQLYNEKWYCNIILKARQLGLSTFINILFLDRCLFNDHVSAGIICHTREDAELMFRRVKFAFDHLPIDVKKMFTAKTDSARELVFSNNSSIRVGTSMRGSTLQYLHVSELGKISVKYPDKAEEIVTGSLNTIAPGQFIFIESTAEGREGYFYDMCKRAERDQQLGKELSKIDFKFHFYPWYEEPSYRIGGQVALQQESLEYFESLSGRGIRLDAEQKWWYCAKSEVQSDLMMREYPSTSEEAFETGNKGAYYSKQMSLTRVEKRICRVPYDETVPVHTAWDLGYNDATSIILFQVINKEIHIINYFEGSGESLQYWLNMLKNLPYGYEKHLAPHDIMAHELTTGMTRQSSARKLGFNMIAVPKLGVIEGIDQVRNIFNRCWFDEHKCEKLLLALDGYTKEWDDRHGCWRSNPLHNWASHGCFTRETLVLTRNGTSPIIDIQKDDEILTLQGWAKCNKATIMRKNAPLVAVTFQDGMKVRCTPDHLFLTQSGWISARFLEKGFKIQSSLIPLPPISEALYTASGLLKDILKKVVHTCTEMYGKTLSAKFLKDVTFITKTTISRTIASTIWNVFRPKYTFVLSSPTAKAYQNWLEIRRVSGINLRRDENGIADTPYDRKDGSSGKERKGVVRFVCKNLTVSSDKTDLDKNTVQAPVRALIIEKVEKLPEKEDVYCINVPGISHFSLSNGAVVHNSDSMRTLATGLHIVTGRKDVDLTTLGGGRRVY